MQKKMRGSIEDDIIGISKQKKLKKPTSANKKTTTKGKVDVGLQKALKNKKKSTTTSNVSQGSTIAKNKIGSSTVKKNKTGQAPTKTGKVKATAANTKNYASTLAMQKRLKKLGAKIDADGIMGPKTRAAIKKYIKNPSTLKKNKSKVMVDSFKKSNVSANKNKKAGIDAAKGDNKKAKIFKSSNPKLDSKGNYKGTNIKPTKLQLERMRKRMMGST